MSVGPDVSICIMLLGCMIDEISTVVCWVESVYMHHIVEWHDRRGQHGCVLGQIYLYAPYKLDGMTDGSVRLRVGSDVSISTI